MATNSVWVEGLLDEAAAIVEALGHEPERPARFVGIEKLPRRVTVSLTFPVSSTSRRPGARVVANSTAPIFFSVRPAKPRL